LTSHALPYADRNPNGHLAQHQALALLHSLGLFLSTVKEDNTTVMTLLD
jgi:hypothetical protein